MTPALVIYTAISYGDSYVVCENSLSLVGALRQLALVRGDKWFEYWTEYITSWADGCYLIHNSYLGKDKIVGRVYAQLDYKIFPLK